MTDKQMIIDGCEFQSDCIEYKDISYLKIMPICAIHELSIACHDKVNKCKYYKLYKQLKRKQNELEELRQYHNKCCKEFENEKQELFEKYNQISRDFYNGKYCNKENCSLLKAKEQECDELKDELATYGATGICEVCTDKSVLQNDKYTKALINIKEIAEENIRIADSEGLNGVYRRGLAEQILQKISEVKNNNELY